MKKRHSGALRAPRMDPSTQASLLETAVPGLQVLWFTD